MCHWNRDTVTSHLFVHDFSATFPACYACQTDFRRETIGRTWFQLETFASTNKILFSGNMTLFDRFSSVWTNKYRINTKKMMEHWISFACISKLKNTATKNDAAIFFIWSFIRLFKLASGFSYATVHKPVCHAKSQRFFPSDCGISKTSHNHKMAKWVENYFLVYKNTSIKLFFKNYVFFSLDREENGKKGRENDHNSWRWKVL